MSQTSIKRVTNKQKKTSLPIMPVSKKQRLHLTIKLRIQPSRNNNVTEDSWETKSGLIKHGAISKIISHNRQLIYNALWIPKINSVFCHSFPKSPEKWSVDQLCNSNTLNKAHRGISSVYHHYPNSPHPNEMNFRNSFVPPSVWVWAYGA